MIRIDEIYDNTLWPWIQDRLPLTRLFFCDPPGRSDPDSLHNYGSDTHELHYIFLHDQEPIHLDVHAPLFNDVARRNHDLDHGKGSRRSAIITSERDSEMVDAVCDRYGWQSFYYFFHGWAALDWYRGYDRSFLMIDPAQRRIQHSFVSPNRIIGGKRDHRLLLFYHLLRRGVNNALMSFPSRCPVENTDALHIATKFSSRYPDIITVLRDAALPWCFPGEIDHPMHSCWLSLFQENASSLAHVVTETVYHGRRHHLTEKVFKPICLRMPFVLVSTAHSLKYLRDYGFQTFGDIWDESYDDETDDFRRLEKIADLLISLDKMSPDQLQDIYQRSLPALEHNFHHFYHGGFESRLWQELTDMLQDIEQAWN